MQRSNTQSAAAAGAVVAQSDSAYQAYQVLHWGFVAAPFLAGLDKFFHVLTNWEMYLAPWIASVGGQIGLRASTIMHIVGAIEIVAAALVALKPRVGAYVVALWLVGIIINLLTLPGFYDIALRDFGLCLAAIALGRLSEKFGR